MNVAIYGRSLEEANQPYIQELFDELASRGTTVRIFRDFYPQLEGKIRFQKEPLLFNDHGDLRKGADYLFSLGGDGTLLDTVSLVRDSQIPVMGINVGRMGFLSSIGKEEIRQALNALEQGTFVLDKRDLLHLDSNRPLFGEVNYCLNEFTIHKKDTSAMIVIHAYLNGEFLNSYWADGLIVATPTGSTAYSLACGGPVIFPNSSTFVITPVAPHHLNSRPLIVSDSSVLSFRMEGRSDNFLCTLDSRIETIDSGFKLAVRKESFTLNLVRLHERNFLQSLRDKLFWGYDTRN